MLKRDDSKTTEPATKFEVSKKSSYRRLNEAEKNGGGGGDASVLYPCEAIKYFCYHPEKKPLIAL